MTRLRYAAARQANDEWRGARRGKAATKRQGLESGKREIENAEVIVLRWQKMLRILCWAGRFFKKMRYLTLLCVTSCYKSLAPLGVFRG